MTMIARPAAAWWVGRFDLLHKLEYHSLRRPGQPDIRRVTYALLARHRDLVAFSERRGIALADVLGYLMVADTPEGAVRLVALFPEDPFQAGEPQVFALDGDRRSKHRNAPFDDGKMGHSAHLCLYYGRDPEERRWTPEHELGGLFDLAVQHLAHEGAWRQTGRWPVRDAPHGLPAPARPRPDLAVPPQVLREVR